jgi:Cysteine-rich CWC
MTTTLKRFAAVISPRWREPSTCEACGNQFTCGATLAGCWCAEIKLSNETRAELKGRYNSCLCKECLLAAGSGSDKSDPESAQRSLET